MINLLVALFLQTGVTQAAFPVRLGFTLDRDTVTLGDHVTLIIRLLAPRGSQLLLPAGPDTARKEGSYPIELIGTRVATMHGDTAVVGYRLAAWDVGAQTVNMPDIVVSYRGQKQLVPLTGINLFVRSVLPKDSALWKPKPARDPITLTTFDWKKWMPLLLLLLLAILGWWMWRRYRARAGLPLDPYERAKTEFARIEREYPADSNPNGHLTEMVDVMRDYLAARVVGVRRSYTTVELVPRLNLQSEAQQRLPFLLETSDGIKFARATATPSEARSGGQTARTIVDEIEARRVAAEAAEKEGKMERAA